MRFFDCPALGRQVGLTDEREEHIERRHEDLLPEHLEELRRTLAEPHELVPDPLDDECVWFIRWTDTIKGGRFVLAVVCSDPGDPPRSWIITAFLTRSLPPRLQ